MDPTPTIPWAIAFGQKTTGRSLRQIAAISKVSSGQVSRLASGKSGNPSVETTLALAPALGIHPTCLLTLAGHLGGRPGQRALRELVDRAGEAIIEAYDAGYLGSLREQVTDAATDDALRDLAVVLITLPVHDVDYPADLAPLTAARMPDAALLDEIIQSWPTLTPDRRWRLLELTRDLQRVSTLENQSSGKEAA